MFNKHNGKSKTGFITIAGLDLPPMLIAVNHCFTGTFPGENSFARQLLKRLILHNPEGQFLIFTTAALPEPAFLEKNVQLLPIRPPAGKLPLQKMIWQRRLSRVVQQHQPDILINLNPFLTIHTVPLQLLLADEAAVAFFSQAKGTARKKFALNMRLACKIGIPSASEEQRLQPMVAPLKKLVVVNAGAELPAVKLDWAGKEPVKEKYADGKEYFLVQQALLPEAMLMNILKAFSFFKRRQQSEFKLLIPAMAMEKQEAWEEKLATYKYRSAVQILPEMPVSEKLKLVAAAYAIIDIAPHAHARALVIQAFESQTPLIVNKTGQAMFWTGTDAALRADVTAPESIATQLMLLYKDEHLRKRLLTAGSQKLETFNWEQAAGNLQRCLDAIIQKS